MRWILLTLICAPLHADCEWYRIGSYRSEEVCVAAGLTLGEDLRQFRCRELRVESIPLPRPRPQ